MNTIILLIVYVLIGALSIGLAVPLIQGRVKPNPWYGVRLPKTLKDPETWYAVNAYFGRRFAVYGLFIAASGVVLSPIGFIRHTGSVTYMLVEAVLITAGLAWITVDTLRYLRKF